jgi:Predicted phosphohydrolases
MLQLRREFLKSAASTLVGATLLRPHNLFAQEAKAKVDPYADAVLVDGEPAPLADGAFSLVVLPDTQIYSERFPELFQAQTEWIVAQKQARNIVGVVHLGDITNRATPAEWENARAAMSILDGQVPYFLVPGNHDYSEQGKCTDRTTLLSDYFPVERFRGLPTFGGTYDKEPDRLENSYHQVTACGQKLLFLCLEYGPRKDVVRWANAVVEANPDAQVILVTHAYMYHDDTRYDWKTYGKNQRWNPHAYPIAAATGDDVMDGEELWTNLVSKHKNFIMTINGHVLYDGLARLTSQSPQGNSVHQMLVNFQMRPRGGDGFLRILEFNPLKNTISACDYSPVRGQRNESPQNMFHLDWAPLVQS